LRRPTSGRRLHYDLLCRAVRSLHPTDRRLYVAELTLPSFGGKSHFETTV
jgi:hypothetical protein